MGGAMKETGFFDANPVTFDDWDSGRVKLTQEHFFPCFVQCRGFFGQTSEKLVGFKGKETGTILGPWADEVLEMEDCEQ